MARQAGVKLTLENAQFLTSVKKSGEAVQRMATESKRSLADQFGAGATAAKRSISGLAGELKMATRWATTLGGAFTLGKGIKDAIHAQTVYRQIAFGVRDANGAMLKSADVQRIAERAAAKTGQTNADMAQSFKTLLDTSGSVEFSRKVLDAVGTTAMATGESLGDLTTLADQLNSKFGVGADQMLDTFAQVFGAAKKGGPSFAEFAEVSGSVGAELLAAGLDGKRGLDFMLGALNATDAEFKSLPKQVLGLKAVLRGLGEKTELTKLANSLGIDPKKLINEKDAIARLKRIFGAGRAGVKALLAPMHQGEEKRTMQILFTDPFEKALAEAEKSGLKGQAAIDKALTVVDAGMKGFGKSNMTGAQIIDEANKARNTPEAKLTDALNRLSTAFDRPEIIKAITDLAQHLPALADIVGDVVGFAAKHPILAAGGAVAGKVGMDVAGEVAGGLISSGVGALAKRFLGKGAAKAAGGAVSSLAGGASSGLGEMAVSGLQRYHQFGMAGGITAEMLGAGGGAVTAGELGAAGIGTGSVLGGAALAALPFAAIGAGGLAAGYGIKKSYDNEGDVMRELQNATITGASQPGLAGKKAALARLETAFGAAKEADIGGGVFDTFARTVTGVDTKTQANEQLQESARAIIALRGLIAKMEAAGPSTQAEAKAAEAKPKPVSLDSTAPKMIAEATKTALGGMVLTVRMATGPGLGNVAPGGGSRGPANVPPAQQGGAV
jgi:hypothetical protein